MMIIIEGTDAVGKTSTIKELEKSNIFCNDRNKDIFSKYMLLDYSVEYRSEKYYEFLSQNDCLVIFLINNDSDELLRRVKLRDVVDEFDLQAPLYNQLYKNTFDYMNEHNMLLNKLFLVDVTGLPKTFQVDKVKEVILCQV